MKKIIIVLAVLLSAFTTQKDFIYKSKNIDKSIRNLETIRDMIKSDGKENINLKRYDLLIDQNINNLLRNIDPKRPYNDYSGNLHYVLDRVNGLQITLNYAYQCDHIKSLYFEELTKDILNIKKTIKLLKK